MVDVYFLGDSSFKIKGKVAQILINPLGGKLAGLEADVVLLTKNEQVKAKQDTKPFVIAGPGEYEIKGINVVGSPLSNYTFYQFLIDGVSFAHLGELSEKLAQKQLEVLGNIDVLMLGVSQNPKVAVEIVSQLEPAIVLPMHEGESRGSQIEQFLKQIGGAGQPEKKLSLSKDKLPEETQVKLLEVTKG